MPIVIGRLKKDRSAQNQVWDAVLKDGFVCSSRDKVSRKPAAVLKPHEEHWSRFISFRAKDDHEAQALIGKYKDECELLEVEAVPVLPVYTGDTGQLGPHLAPPPSASTTPDFRNLQNI